MTKTNINFAKCKRPVCLFGFKTQVKCDIFLIGATAAGGISGLPSSVKKSESKGAYQYRGLLFKFFISSSDDILGISIVLSRLDFSIIFSASLQVQTNHMNRGEEIIRIRPITPH